MSWPWTLAALALLGGCATTQRKAPTAYEGPVFDVHAHIEPTARAGHINPKVPATVKMLLAQMQTSGVTGAAAIVVPDQDPDVVSHANAELLAASERHPGRLVPVASLPSEDPKAALAELERAADEGFRAVKVTPPHNESDPAGLGAVVARAADLHLVVLIDGWSQDMDALAKLALDHPKAKLLVAHLGGVRFTDMLLFDVLRRSPVYKRNVWFDLSSVAHLYAHSPFAGQLAWACRQVGTDRILFGSDFPLVPLSEALADVRALGFTPDEQRQILHDNAEALFGLRSGAVPKTVTAAAPTAAR